MDYPHLDGLTEVSTAPATATAVPESQPTPVAPQAVELAPVAPSSSDAYEKDPETATSETTPSANSTLQQRLVQQYQDQLRKQADAGRESLLKRLVLNAAEPTSDSDFQGQ